MYNTGNSGVARRIYYLSFFLKFLQINNKIPYLLAAQKKNFSFEIFVRKSLENKAF